MLAGMDRENTLYARVAGLFAAHAPPSIDPWRAGFNAQYSGESPRTGRSALRGHW